MKNELFYTAKYKQDITLYHIYSDCKRTLMTAVVMKTTELDELLERQGGVTRFSRKTM
jgi:hypothetical protein